MLKDYRGARQAALLAGRCLILSAIPFAVGMLVAAPSPTNEPTIQFAVISDLHFNPFLCSNEAYECLSEGPSKLSDSAWLKRTFDAFERGTENKAEAQGQDSSYSLIERSLRSLASTNSSLAFVLCTGDFFAHAEDVRKTLGDNYSMFTKNKANYVLASEALVARMFAKEGFTRVFPVMGNNDSFDDYDEPTRAFKEAFMEAWAPLAPSGTYGDDFRNLGCYEASLPNLMDFRIVAFDSTVFSADPDHVTGPHFNSWTSAVKTMTWLLGKVDAGAPCLLAYHIPPGFNPWVLLSKNSEIDFWEGNFANQFVTMVADNQQRIIGSFCAHTHNDEFRVIYAKVKGEEQPVHFIHIAPSIGLNHKDGKPAYQIFTARRDGRILNYTTYVLADLNGPANDWTEEYSFAQFTNSYNATNLHKLFLGNDAGTADNRDVFAGFRSAGVPDPDHPVGDLSDYWRLTAITNQ